MLQSYGIVSPKKTSPSSSSHTNLCDSSTLLDLSTSQFHSNLKTLLFSQSFNPTSICSHINVCSDLESWFLCFISVIIQASFIIISLLSALQPTFYLHCMRKASITTRLALFKSPHLYHLVSFHPIT